MQGREAAALNNACAAFTGNLQCLHGSGNQSPQVINGEGHNTHFFFGSSSRHQPGLLSKTHTLAPAVQKAPAPVSCATGTRWPHRHRASIPAARGWELVPGGSGGSGSVPVPGLAPAFLLALG